MKHSNASCSEHASLFYYYFNRKCLACVNHRGSWNWVLRNRRRTWQPCRSLRNPTTSFATLTSSPWGTIEGANLFSCQRRRCGENQRMRKRGRSVAVGVKQCILNRDGILISEDVDFSRRCWKWYCKGKKWIWSNPDTELSYKGTHTDIL